MSRVGLAAIGLFLLSLSHPADARPTDLIVDQPVDIRELPPSGLVPYNTLFLNRCASGCLVRVGTSNSINDTWQIGSNRTLTAFPYGDTVWQQVMDCVKDVMEPYNITVTDVDPGTANHFEIMIAGSPTDLGMPTSIGGVAPGNGTCTGYINNALVFDFAKVWGSSTCGSGCVEDICSTAAQEIGHTWHAMDHVIVNTDPMTYFGSTTRKYYQNTAAQCGSDCVNGQSPTGFTCSGTNNQSHPCICGGNTQNSDQTLVSLFGAGPGTPPTVKITSPKFGQSVDPGFSVYSEAMDNSGIITKVELRIDGNVISTLMNGPFVFNSPATLGNGTHKVEIDAYDPHSFKGSAIVDVVIGPPCQDSGDCTTAGDVCIGGRCVPGSGVMGGLGTVCMTDADCVSGHCQADTEGHKYCVEDCMIGQCPSDFGCLTPDGSDTGVCWPGYDDGSGGGCGCQSSKGGPLSISVLFGWVVLSWRRRRARS